LLLTGSLLGLSIREAKSAPEVLTYDIQGVMTTYHMPAYALPPDARVLRVSLEFYQDTGTHPKGSVIEARFTQFWFRTYKVLTASVGDQAVGTGDLFNCKMEITFDRVSGLASTALNLDPIADAMASGFIVGFEEAWRAYPIYEVKYVSQVPTVIVFPKAMYKFIIVTDEAWQDVAQSFIRLKASRGMPVLVISRQLIETTYAGDSLEQKIWYFLRDAYNRWQPNYLLIAGDTNVLPTWTTYRSGLFVQGAERTSDWFYGLLDGPSDMLPEILVSRLPARDRITLQDMLSKTVDYHDLQPSDWTRRALLIAGEDYQIRKSYFVETMNNFAKDYIPPEMVVTKLYAGYNLTADNIISEINKGVGIVVVDAHGSASGFDPFYVSEAARLANGRMLPVIETFSCGLAPYDSGFADNWALAMLKNPNGGAIGVIGSPFEVFTVTHDLGDGPHIAYLYPALLFGRSLPEWYPGRSDVSSYLESMRSRPFREGDNYFFDALLDLSFWAGNLPGRNFLGDPDISLVGFQPRSLSLEVPSYWSPEGEVTIGVLNGATGNPIPGIVVRVASSTLQSFYFESSTDRTGLIKFKLPDILLQSGRADITVYALNYNTAVTTTLTINAPPNQPPTLSNGYLMPDSGTALATFSYWVTYADPEGAAPTRALVYLSGTPATGVYIVYGMSLVNGSYTSGALFRYRTTLPVGSYSFYFEFSDGVNVVRLPGSGSYSGPTVSASPTLIVSFQGNTYAAAVNTNATVADLSFDSDRRLLNFTISGPYATVGSFAVLIPKALLDGMPLVFVDNAEVACTWTENGTHYTINFSYPLSQHTVTIGGSNTIPEFWSGPLLIAISTLVTAILGRRRKEWPGKPGGSMNRE
jgi:hypothetical protein